MLVGLPFFGCMAESTQTSSLSGEEEQGVCAVLRHGQPDGGLCCVDMSDGENPTLLGAVAPLVSGLNYWSATPQLHNDANYSAALEECMAGGGSRPGCHEQVVTTWGRDGVRFASGSGRRQIAEAVGGIEVWKAVLEDAGGVEAIMELVRLGKEQFRCVEARWNAGVQSRMAKSSGGGQCVRIEEGMAILAQSMRMDEAIHPSPEPFRNIPDCTEDGQCQVWEGKWARVCAAHSRELELDLQSGETGLTALVAKLGSVPCSCRWLLLTRLWLASAVFPVQPLVMSTPHMPRQPTCSPRLDGGLQCDLQGALHPFSLPGLHFATPAYHRRTFLLDELALSRDDDTLWNDPFPDLAHFATVRRGNNASRGPDRGPFRRREPDWEEVTDLRGNLSLVARDCAAVEEELCWLQKMSNVTGVELGCIDAKAAKVASAKDLFSRVYSGFWDRYSSADEQRQEEFVLGLDLHDSVVGAQPRLNVSVMYNNTTPFSFRPPALLRLAAPVRAVIDAFVAQLGAAAGATAAMTGMKEMPKQASILSLDLGGTVGPFFFSLAFSLLFPTIVVSLVYEKEMRLRVMMEMMGLGRSAYWLINYVFWFCIYALFTIVFVGAAYLLRLPSGYRIGLLTRQAVSIHCVFFFLVVNQTIALAFLWASILSSARHAQISGTLFVMAMTLIAWTTWDNGNYFNADDMPESAKTLITIFPIWGMYRGLLDYAEYAFQSANQGTPGLQWQDLADDPRVGIDTTMVCLAVEWVLFLAAAMYLDQILPTGHGVPAHPLFCFGARSSVEEGGEEHRPGDVEAEGGGADVPADVKEEEERVLELLRRRKEQALPAVLVEGIRKEFVGRTQSERNVAVQTLTMSVEHGECFGMLGPNGAGKTTLINMLVGFMRPTRGGARVEGFDVRSDMAKIYTIMGVCPQHDILWGSLSARKHMLFYGRLKNLQGPELETAVEDGLRSVNLLHVAAEPVQTFSGGMKRRLSVAIALIGKPLCCYLDEPSTGLDPASRRTLWRAVTKAKKSGGLLLTTHSMEEAEGLCDRIGIFVSGRLRCVGEPKALAARFGGAYTLTITSASDPARVAALVSSFAPTARLTYSLADTHKFEFATSCASLSTIFGSIARNSEPLALRDWGIANTTLEEAFIKIAKESNSLQ